MSRATNQTTVIISGTVKAETGKAILVLVSSVNGALLFPDDPAKTKQIWFPFSQVSNIVRTPGKETTLRVMEWLALKTPEIEAALKQGTAGHNENADEEYAAFKARLASKGTGGARTREDDEGYDDPDGHIPY